MEETGPPKKASKNDAVEVIVALVKYDLNLISWLISPI